MGMFSMPSLAFVRDERFVLASLGVAAVGIVTVMRLILAEYRDSVEIKPPQPKTQYITQDTEDALRLSTLDSLLGHYNFAIRETAAKIVCDRAVNDGVTVNDLLWGITRIEYEDRMKNLRALAMITDQCEIERSLSLESGRRLIVGSIDSLQLLNTPKAYSAFVRSLELCVNEAQYERLDDKYFDEYQLRDMAERMCLVFILQLVTKYDSKQLIKAQFIEKWLARQAWGDSDEERQRNFAGYMRHKQNRITEIYQRLQESKLGRDTLEKVKLVPAGSSNDTNDDGAGDYGLVLSIRMNNDSIDDQDGEGRPIEGSQPRILEQSAEEQRIRRQRREAMVYSR